MTLRESYVEKELRKYVVSLGGKFIKIRGGGLPDRLIVLPKGVIGFLEIKRPNERPRKLQVQELKELRDLHQQAGWCDSIESGKQFIDSLRGSP